MPSAGGDCRDRHRRLLGATAAVAQLAAGRLTQLLLLLFVGLTLPCADCRCSRWFPLSVSTNLRVHASFLST